jgi:hypothetical protein
MHLSKVHLVFTIEIYKIHAYQMFRYQFEIEQQVGDNVTGLLCPYTDQFVKMLLSIATVSLTAG